MNSATFRVLLGATVVVAWAGCSSPYRNAPRAVISDAIETPVPVETPAATAPAPSAGPAVVYRLSGDTYIGFAGSKPLGKHYGQFPVFDGSVTVRNNDLTTADINVTIDVTAIETDDTRLTGTLKGDKFFDVENYPNATFVSTGVTKADGGYTVAGNLTIRGTTKGITFPADITLTDDTLKAHAEFNLDRNQWGIGVGWTQVVIHDNVFMELDVEAVTEK